MRTSVIFFPNKAKQSLRTKRIPIYVRVLHNGVKAEARLSEEVSEHELIKWNPMIMRVNERDSSLNVKLNAISKIYDDFKISNASTLDRFDAKKIRDMLVCENGIKDQKILLFAQSFYENSIMNNGNLSIGTKKNYKKAIKHLVDFVKKEKKESARLTDLDSAFSSQVWDYLLADDTEKNKHGMTEVSASGIIKKFRTIFDRAVNEELIKSNPFKKLKLKHKSPFRQRLSVTEVKQWRECNLENFPSLEIYKDIFLFCFYTGLAYSDVMSLEWSHLITLQSSRMLLRKKRHKTGELTEVILSSFAWEIINKYKDSKEIKQLNQIFPKKSLHSINSYFKIIAEKSGIQVKVTSHIARHTFRQLITEAGIEDDSVIKRMMGQSRRNSIDETYYDVTESRLNDASKKFELFLNQYL